MFRRAFNFIYRKTRRKKKRKPRVEEEEAPREEPDQSRTGSSATEESKSYSDHRKARLTRKKDAEDEVALPQDDTETAILTGEPTLTRKRPSITAAPAKKTPTRQPSREGTRRLRKAVPDLPEQTQEESSVKLAKKRKSGAQRRWKITEDRTKADDEDEEIKPAAPIVIPEIYRKKMKKPPTPLQPAEEIESELLDYWLYPDGRPPKNGVVVWEGDLTALIAKHENKPAAVQETKKSDKKSVVLSEIPSDRESDLRKQGKTQAVGLQPTAEAPKFAQQAYGVADRPPQQRSQVSASKIKQPAFPSKPLQTPVQEAYYFPTTAPTYPPGINPPPYMFPTSDPAPKPRPSEHRRLQQFTGVGPSMPL
ncbi:unnamed protein product [Cylicocyclus nassatus]|uniref:Uncharacterized protein n=1 Tax=Cylicocyclus nassatus TaxID=53992 RepID=A0AA36DSC6_CYLNA|nr:unnamed protein product [Cylicocyclus nassatus]